MTTLSILGLTAVVFGSVALHLAAPRQRWLESPLPARPTRLAGALLLAAGWVLWTREIDALTATYVLLTSVMVLFVALPHLGALVAMRRED
ncbi:MAG: hypothetical protein JJ863_00765 [Deltaproteobacteria bacterium]|nr:hypothetical protein [Deltaproteobacteria bacterium]